MKCKTRPTRRDLLAQAACGLAGSLALLRAFRAPAAQSACVRPSRVALVHGQSRAENTFQALKLIEGQIREGLAKKRRVVIKPNMVVTNNPLSATHAECLEGLLEFFRPLVKDEIFVAESPANGPAAEGYANYKYDQLTTRYRVRFVELDEQPFVIEHVVDERYHPRPVRVSKFLMDPEVYLVSAAVFKTHDRAVVTLSLKNVIFGALLKDRGFRWGPGSKGSTDKPTGHGGPRNQGIHYNLLTLGKRLHPDLAVIDGFQGMEGNGPCSGTPVDHKVVVAGTDWLAADRTVVELMGFDFHKIGYLTFCARAGLGQGDLNQIEVVGARVADHLRRYRPHDNIEDQYKWMS